MWNEEEEEETEEDEEKEEQAAEEEEEEKRREVAEELEGRNLAVILPLRLWKGRNIVPDALVLAMRATAIRN